MILFQVDLVESEKRQRVLVYAETGIAARAYLRTKFPASELQNLKELPNETKHFVLAAEQKS